MANNKKLVEAITSMEDDFAQWYTDVVKKAELCGYTSVKGCMAIKPAGYAIWENIQHELDRRFKETGIRNTKFLRPNIVKRIGNIRKQDWFFTIKKGHKTPGVR